MKPWARNSCATTVSYTEPRFMLATSSITAFMLVPKKMLVNMPTSFIYSFSRFLPLFSIKGKLGLLMAFTSKAMPDDIR